MKKIKNCIMIMILLLAAGSFINTRICKAASAEVTITADRDKITVGDEFNVYITIKSETKFADFETNLTYDDDLLEFDSNNPAITGSSGFIKISDTNVSEGSNNRKYTLKFKALQVGSCDIDFSGRAVVYDDETGDEMSVAQSALTVSVNAAETASDNASLKSLKISPSQLSPTFDKNTVTYSTSVDYDTEKLVVNAIPEDEKAVIKISGNESLKEGENKVIVTVIAESGTVIEYTINVIREKAPATQEVTSTPTIAPEAKQGTFEVAAINGELYAVYNGKYKLVEPDSSVAIPAGYQKTAMILSDESVTVYTLVNDPDSQFVLIYAENELGEAGFYRFDSYERTLQRYVPDNTGNIDTAKDSDQAVQSKEYRSNLNKTAITIAILSILCVVLLVILIRLYMKERDRK